MAHKAKGNRRNLKHDLVMDRVVSKQLVADDSAIREFMRKREEIKKRRESDV
jgi:hypothetical protein